MDTKLIRSALENHGCIFGLFRNWGRRGDFKCDQCGMTSNRVRVVTVSRQTRESPGEYAWACPDRECWGSMEENDGPWEFSVTKRRKIEIHL